MPLPTTIPREGDLWARPRSKLRCVFDCLSDGAWHTGSQLHAAYNRMNQWGEKDAWSMPSAVAQLRAKLRPKGGDVISEGIDGRNESRYRMILPRQAKLQPHLARTKRVVAEAQRELAL